MSALVYWWLHPLTGSRTEQSSPMFLQFPSPIYLQEPEGVWLYKFLWAASCSCGCHGQLWSWLKGYSSHRNLVTFPLQQWSEYIYWVVYGMEGGSYPGVWGTVLTPHMGIVSSRNPSESLFKESATCIWPFLIVCLCIFCPIEHW